MKTLLGTLLNSSSSTSNSILAHYNDVKPPYITGIRISGDSIFSICPGKVVDVEEDRNKYVVSMLVNSKQMIRYANLRYCDVSSGQDVDFNTYIGKCNKYVQLEYCTTDKLDSIWPVRVKDISMFKHDPEGLLTGDVKLNIIVDTALSDDVDIYYNNAAMKDELTNNRGE